MAQDILVFGEDWGAHPSSTQHLFKHLARDRNVLWVNSIGLRRPRLRARDARRLIQKVGAMGKPSAAAFQPFPVMAPRAISWPGNPLARLINSQLLVRQIKAQLAKRGMNDPLIWTSLPTFADIMQAFPQSPIIYYCGDDFGGLDGVDHAPVVACEARLAARADLILVASEALAAKFPGHKTHVVPHGVDFEQFSRPVAERAIRPTAGFYGSIAPWLDIDLLAQVARGLPDWEFVMIGEVKTDVSALMGLENVRFEPAMAHHKLPAQVQSWWAGLLPFRDCAQIRACNPLKLREYLASGTPVVSTPFPALEVYKDLVSVASGPEAMINALKGYEARHSGAVVRQKAVQFESWSNRAREVSGLLANLTGPYDSRKSLTASRVVSHFAT